MASPNKIHAALIGPAPLLGALHPPPLNSDDGSAETAVGFGYTDGSVGAGSGIDVAIAATVASSFSPSVEIGVGMPSAA